MVCRYPNNSSSRQSSVNIFLHKGFYPSITYPIETHKRDHLEHNKVIVFVVATGYPLFDPVCMDAAFDRQLPITLQDGIHEEFGTQIQPSLYSRILIILLPI